jgi:hypothetical protein
MRKSVVLTITTILFLLLGISVLSYTIISFEKEDGDDGTPHLEIGIDLVEYMEDYDIRINISNTGDGDLRIDNEPPEINIYVSNMDGVEVWSANSIVGLEGNESIEPGGFITHHVSLNTEWNLIDRTTSLPYGQYMISVVFNNSEYIFRNSTEFHHTPIVDMEISGETVDGKGLAIVSYTNKRNYTINYSAPHEPWTDIDIYDENGIAIFESGRVYLTVYIEGSLKPGEKIYRTITFFSDFWNEILRPGYYRIEAFSYAFPLKAVDTIYFEGYVFPY